MSAADSPRQIRDLLGRLGIALKKRWGQNFLVNPGARGRILRLLDPGPAQAVWEIGPGLGALTGELLRRAGKLVAFEVDRGLVDWLERTYGADPRFILVAGDVLKTWREALARYGRPDQVVGNLPYRSASAIIGDFIEGGLLPAHAVFTVQKELAQRMTARPGGRNYSSFSVLCQYAFHIREAGDLKPGSFYPPPEVTSTVVELRPRADLPAPRDRRVFLLLVRGLFAARRKTLRNNLLGAAPRLGLPPGELLEAARRAGLDPGGRGEELRVEDFLRLADEVSRARPADLAEGEGPTGGASP